MYNRDIFYFGLRQNQNQNQNQSQSQKHVVCLCLHQIFRFISCLCFGILQGNQSKIIIFKAKPKFGR